MVAGGQRLVHTPFVPAGYWSPCAPLVSDPVKVPDIRFSSSHFRKQHPRHEKAFIGSSLLFVHDQSGYANIWLIDFAKIASPSNNQIRVNHRSVWKFGNYEDGYLIGIDNLVKLFEEIIHECQ
ncbi:unnamed protein product [Schistosoma margrebowiei]|uniref:Kinase n=1 Tax=Schistosoma margrebowiei TaxID=48269 RepID=A0A183N035_9TREM|nr:unnamed protein product [Schistosoma margrebowiei]